MLSRNLRAESQDSSHKLIQTILSNLPWKDEQNVDIQVF